MAQRLLAARNVLKAILLMAGGVAAVAALGWWLGGVRVGGVFLLLAVLMAATLYWYGPRVILAALEGRELTLAEAPALHTAVERLAAAAGAGRPRLYLLPGGYPRALSVGRGAGDAAVAVSEGLLAVATPAELEGVLAHELAHVRHRDLAIQTPLVLLALLLLETSRIGGFLERALLFVLAPLAAALVNLLLSPKRELAADAEAARICGSPHPLADALVHLEQAMELGISFQASPATEPLYTVNPFGADRVAAMFGTHPPIAERVQRLRSLDPGWRERLRAA